MINIIFWLYIALEIFSRLILIDVILSWLTAFWFNIRPKFLRDLIDPLYAFIKKHIQTSISVFDFTPIILLLIIIVFQILLVWFFPELNNYIKLYLW